MAGNGSTNLTEITAERQQRFTLENQSTQRKCSSIIAELDDAIDDHKKSLFHDGNRIQEFCFDAN